MVDIINQFNAYQQECYRPSRLIQIDAISDVIEPFSETLKEYYVHVVDQPDEITRYANSRCLVGPEYNNILILCSDSYGVVTQVLRFSR